MAVWPLEGDGAVLEELDERWPAHPEEVGGLLGREPEALRGDEGGLALAHHLDHLTDPTAFSPAGTASAAYL